MIHVLIVLDSNVSTVLLRSSYTLGSGKTRIFISFGKYPPYITCELFSEKLTGFLKKIVFYMRTIIRPEIINRKKSTKNPSKPCKAVQIGIIFAISRK